MTAPATAPATTAAPATSDGPPALDATDLYRFYHAGDEETLALKGVSLELRAGEIVAVTGPSGSGKSTLLACLAGLDEPDGGMVRYGTEAMSRQSEADRAALRARRVGMLFQSGNLLDHLTVEQNVLIAQRLAGRVDRAAARDVLRSVGLSDRAGATPTTLSGGEAARAGLAVALANEPTVILTDEPTGELDEGTADRLMAMLRERAAAGAAVLIVTHNAAVAAEADRQIQLLDGRIHGESDR
ncbi:MAG: transporter ATP-binding protein [Acidimicrobiales bacterium]|nr:transporter ATP-binding protein [Acidimicrobiales bacterium]